MIERADMTDPSGGSIEARRVVGSYPTYEEAQAAVDALSDEGFPVERVAIVGSGLRWVEQVTGRLEFVRAALDGALSGGFAGVLFGFVLGIFVVDDTDAIALLFLGLVFGVVFGAIWGLLAHWASGGRRDFTSVPGIVADRYDVIVDTEVADEAERLLAARTSSRD